MFLNRAVKRAFLPLRSLTSFLRPGVVAMLHIGRCGSKVLADLLEQNKKICWGHEIYQRYFESLEAKGISIAPNSVRGESPYRLLQHQMRFSGARFYGFEVKFYHLRCYGVEPSGFVDKLEKLGIHRFILLERRNYLRKVVSSVVAHETHKYHLATGSKPDLVRVKIDVHELTIDYDRKPLLEFLRGYQEDTLGFQRLMNGRAFLKLTYEEDILQDPKKAYNQVCNFIGVPPTEVVTRYARTTPYPLREVITNIQEVESALAGTEFAWMLED